MIDVYQSTILDILDIKHVKSLNHWPPLVGSSCGQNGGLIMRCFVNYGSSYGLWWSAMNKPSWLMPKPSWLMPANHNFPIMLDIGWQQSPLIIINSMPDGECWKLTISPSQHQPPPRPGSHTPRRRLHRPALHVWRCRPRVTPNAGDLPFHGQWNEWNGWSQKNPG